MSLPTEVIEEARDFLYRISASQNSTLSIKAKKELATAIAKQIMERGIVNKLQVLKDEVLL